MIIREIPKVRLVNFDRSDTLSFGVSSNSSQQISKEPNSGNYRHIF